MELRPVASCVLLWPVAPDGVSSRVNISVSTEACSSRSSGRMRNVATGNTGKLYNAIDIVQELHKNSLGKLKLLLSLSLLVDATTLAPFKVEDLGAE